MFFLHQTPFIVEESPVKLPHQSKNLLPYFPPNICPPIKIQKGVGVEGTQAPLWKHLGPFHANTTRIPKLPEPHTSDFSGVQDTYGRCLPGPHNSHTTASWGPFFFYISGRQDVGERRMEGRQDVPSQLLGASSHISPKFA